MEHYAGIDVSLELSSVCVVDTKGKIVKEAKVASDPEDLIAFFASLGFAVKRIGLEAGPLSQWLWRRRVQRANIHKRRDTAGRKESIMINNTIKIGNRRIVTEHYHRTAAGGVELIVVDAYRCMVPAPQKWIIKFPPPVKLNAEMRQNLLL